MSFDIFHFPMPNLQIMHHSDTVHHVEFDFYGKRVATCSSDKVVCIWDRTPEGWIRSAHWKKHGAAVWKTRFAHPEYGQILATCSFDNVVHIYDRDATEPTEIISQAGFHMARGDASNGWSRRAILTGSSSNILDIQFAPYYLGLRLAACTVLGKIMIWDAEDIMSLENWNNTFNLDASSYRLSSISWSSNRFSLPLIVASSDDLNIPSNKKVVVFMFNFNIGYGIFKAGKQKFEFSDQVTCVVFGPSLGLTYHRLAVGVGKNIYIYNIQTQNEDTDQVMQTTQRGTNELELIKQSYVILDGSDSRFPVTQVIRISWNILGDVISVIHIDGIVRAWKYISENTWVLMTELNPPNEFSDKRDTVYY